MPAIAIRTTATLPSGAPDLQIPGEDYSRTPFGWKVYWEENGKHYDALLTEFDHNGETWWVADVVGDVRGNLTSKLGGSRVRPLEQLLNSSASARARVLQDNADKGHYRPIKNATAQVVALALPHVIAGHNPHGVMLDDTDPEDATPLHADLQVL